MVVELPERGVDDPHRSVEVHPFNIGVLAENVANGVKRGLLVDLRHCLQDDAADTRAS